MVFVSHAPDPSRTWCSGARSVGFGPGFYIDVGAADPSHDSVTKAFYDAGWRGINVEPMLDAFESLQQAREARHQPADGVGRPRGHGRVLQRRRRKRIVDRRCGRRQPARDARLDRAGDEGRRGHARGGLRPLRELRRSTSSRSTSKGWRTACSGVPTSRATGPGSSSSKRWRRDLLPHDETSDSGASLPVLRTHESWEPELLGCGYEFVLFDGLNRFYVAREKAEMFGPALATPANVLDGFVRGSELRGLQELQATIEARDQLQERCDSLRVSLHAAEQEASKAARGSNGWSPNSTSASTVDRRRSKPCARSSKRRSRRCGSRRGRSAPCRRTCNAPRTGGTTPLTHGDAVVSELQALYATRAWRLTKPLRFVRSKLRRSRVDT